MAATHSLIVQYEVDGFGTDADLERRCRLQDLLDRALRRTLNGMCDGGDLGGGTMNIFLEQVVDPQRACGTVVETLRKASELEGAVIALDLNLPDNSEEGVPFVVLWPDGYTGEFDIL